MEKIAALSLLLIACVPSTAPSGTDEARGTWKPSEKADSPATCAGFCGGRSPGRCWCDVACSGWGDCCPDYQNVCSAPTDLGGSGYDAGGTTGSGGYDLAGGGTTGWGGYDAGGTTGWGGYDLAGGGTTGGGFDLGGPTYDAGTAFQGAFTANIPVARTIYYNGSLQYVTHPPVSIFCNVTSQSGIFTINCGDASTWVPIGQDFTVWTTAGSLHARAILTNQLELYSLDYSSPTDESGYSYVDQWSGLIVQSVNPN
jgi:hypothetical protein